MSKDLLAAYILNKVRPPEAELEEFTGLFEPRSFAKNEHIFQAGDIIRFGVFVAKGCLRQYYLSPEGVERIMYFAEEGWWAGDLTNMRNGTPTGLNLQALEDSDLLTLGKQGWEYAFERFGWYRELHTRAQQLRTIKLQEQLGRMLSDSAETKYLTLLKDRPSLLQRVPQHHIATYLGITPETLSRVRRKVFNL